MHLTIGEPERGNPKGGEQSVQDECTTKLSDIFGQPQYRDKDIRYWYSEGLDEWMHSLTVLGHAAEAASADYIFCVGGEGMVEKCSDEDEWNNLKRCVEKVKEGRELNDEEQSLLKLLDGRDVNVWEWDPTNSINDKLKALESESRQKLARDD
jgi:hypothetical protein